MKCTVFRSGLKEFTYIYLAEGSEFGDVPIALRNVFGEPEFVMDLELGPGRKLANAEVEMVLHDLSEHGYHLQMPPRDDPSGLLELPDRKKETLL